MRKLLPLTALTLALSGGVALADHGRVEHRGAVDHRAAPAAHVAVREHYAPRGGVEVRDHRGYAAPGGNRGYVNRGYVDRGYVNRGYVDRGYNRGYVRGVARRPIFVSRPYIGHRYYDYYRRPAIVVENFAPMAGYYWVPGQWDWNGYEWIWQPGHYQPDPAYVDPGYGY